MSLQSNLDKLSRCMIHGRLKEHPDILQALKDYGFYFEGDEDRNVLCFIGDGRIILNNLEEESD